MDQTISSPRSPPGSHIRSMMTTPRLVCRAPALVCPALNKSIWMFLSYPLYSTLGTFHPGGSRGRAFLPRPRNVSHRAASMRAWPISRAVPVTAPPAPPFPLDIGTKWQILFPHYCDTNTYSLAQRRARKTPAKGKSIGLAWSRTAKQHTKKNVFLKKKKSHLFALCVSFSLGWRGAGGW